jgi:hypothetical protein
MPHIAEDRGVVNLLRPVFTRRRHRAVSYSSEQMGRDRPFRELKHTDLNHFLRHPQGVVRCEDDRGENGSGNLLVGAASCRCPRRRTWCLDSSFLAVTWRCRDLRCPVASSSQTQGVLGWIGEVNEGRPTPDKPKTAHGSTFEPQSKPTGEGKGKWWSPGGLDGECETGLSDRRRAGARKEEQQQQRDGCYHRTWSNTYS